MTGAECKGRRYRQRAATFDPSTGRDNQDAMALVRRTTLLRYLLLTSVLALLLLVSSFWLRECRWAAMLAPPTQL